MSTQQSCTTEPSGTGGFEAVLEPNPPLPRFATLFMLGGLALFSLVVGILFIVAGAWPVTGFLGLEVLAFAVLFLICRRRAQQRQRVCIDENGLMLESIDAGGRRKNWLFHGHWARAEANRINGRGSCVILRERGQNVAFGHFLNHDENVSLASAINRALRDFRVRI